MDPECPSLTKIYLDSVLIWLINFTVLALDGDEAGGDFDDATFTNTIDMDGCDERGEWLSLISFPANI